MDLAPFDWSIGISDILAYRECPQRFVFGMRRHVALPERLQLEAGESDEPPESTNWTNALGSATHLAIAAVETEQITHEQAVERAMAQYGVHLTPDDMELLREFLATYARRRPLGVVPVIVERDLRVPLFAHEGHMVCFRFKVDVLYRVLANPEVFIHVDYKTSKWRKTKPEVHSDLQAWAYNWAIHDLLPECRTLLQRYNQLRFQEIPTTKNDAQRAAMKQWLIDNVRNIIADDTYKPKQNDFCRYCPLVVSCRETRRATTHWRGKLSVLAPLTKEGRKVKVEFFDEGLELERVISEDLPDMIATRKHLEHVEKALKEIIGEMPLEERERVGWLLTERKTRSITADGLRELHEAMGDSFYQLVTLPVGRLEELFGKPRKNAPVPVELQIARKWTTEEITGSNLVPAKSG